MTTTTVVQYFDGAAGTGADRYGLDVNNIYDGTNWVSGYDPAGFVPTGSKWELAGFVVDNSNDAASRNTVTDNSGPSIKSMDELISASGTTIAGVSGASVYIHTVFKRDIAVRLYPGTDSGTPDANFASKGGTVDVDYSLLENAGTQYVYMGFGTMKKTSSAADATATLSATETLNYDVTQWKASTSGAAITAGTGTSLASALGFSREWAPSDSKDLEGKVFAFARTPKPVVKQEYTINYMDGATSLGSDKGEVGVDTTTLSTSYTHSGWAFDYWVDESGNKVETLSPDSTTPVSVYAVWKRVFNFTVPSSASVASITQTWNTKDTTTEPTTQELPAVPAPSSITSMNGKWDTAVGWMEADAIPTSSTTTYAGGSNYTASAATTTLYAVYSRSVSLSYANMSGDAPSDFSAPTAPAAQTQHANATGKVEKLSFTNLPSVSTSENYTFAGWSESQNGSGTKHQAGTTFETSPGLTADKTVTLYASWTKNVSKYKVSYLGQTLGSTTDYGVTIKAATAETEFSTATTAAALATAAGAIDGYTFDHGDPANVVPPTGGGTVDVKLYYKRNQYKAAASSTAADVEVAFSITPSNGGNATDGYYYGDTITLAPTGTVESGYGVTYTVTGASGKTYATTAVSGSDTSVTFTVPAEAVTITSKLTIPSRAYTVGHYQMDFTGAYPAEPTKTDTVADDPSLKGEVGTEAAGGTAKTYTGFDAGVETARGTINNDETLNALLVRFQYARHHFAVTGPAAVDDITFTVTKAQTNNTDPAFGDDVYYGDTVTITPSKVPTDGSTIRYSDENGNITSISANATTGVGTFTMPDGAVALKATVSKTATFHIGHYEMDLDGQYPATPTRTTTGEGTVGDTADASPSVPTGFSEDATKTVKGTIEASDTEDNPTVKFYYSRNSYAVTVPAGQQHGISFSASPATALYGQKVTVSASGTPSDNYKLSDMSISPSVEDFAFDPETNTATFTMPASAVELTPTFVDASNEGYYTVTHRKQKIDGSYETDTKTKSGTIGQTVTETANTYEGFVADQASASVEIVAGATGAITFTYDRVVSDIDVSVTAAPDGYKAEAGATAAHATALRTSAGTAAYGDTVTLAPASGLDAGYTLTYVVTSGGTNIAVTDKGNGVATFEMPAAAVTVTATVGLDASYHQLTIKSAEGVTTSRVLPASARAKSGELVVLTAKALSGYEIVESSSNIWKMSTGTATDNVTGAIVFHMPDADVTVTAPVAQQTLIEVPASGPTTTTVTTFYDGYRLKQTGSTYLKEVDSVSGSTTTTSVMSSTSAGADGTVVATIVDDGAGTVTTTPASGATITAETASVGAGKTRTTETSSDASDTSYPRVTTAVTEGSTTTSTMRQTTVSTTTSGDRATATLASPYKVTETESGTETVSTAVVDGATTTVTTGAPTSVSDTTVTTWPVTATIGGKSYDDATRVERTTGGVTTTKHYRAFLEGTGPWTAGYASDDTDIAGADATITEAAAGTAEIKLSVTPSGGTEASGTSTMKYSGSTVSEVSTTVGTGDDAFKVALTGKALAGLDASKYWYALIVRDEGGQMSMTADDVLASDDWASSAETHAYRIEIVRIARNVDGVIAGTVSDLTEAQLADFGLTLSYGDAQKSRKARAGHVDRSALGIEYINTSLATDLAGVTATDASGDLTVPRAGGPGELLVGLGEVRTITYVSNFPRATGKGDKGTFPEAWAENAVARTYTKDENPFGLTGWTVESWSTSKTGTSGSSYAPGADIGTAPLTGDLTLYAQWKWDLTEDFTDAKGYGTEIELYSDAAKTVAYSATYNAAAQVPSVAVKCADGIASSFPASSRYTLPASSYTVSFEKKYDAAFDTDLASAAAAAKAAAEADGGTWDGFVAAGEVKGAGTYRAVVTAAAGGKAAAGTFATKEFTIAKAAQALTVPTKSYTKTYGDKPFQIAGVTVASTVAGGTAAGAVQYASANAAYATVAANGTVTIVKSTTGTQRTTDGTVKINVTAAETANYKAATVPVSLTINQATRTITCTRTFQKAVGDKPFNLGAKLSDSEGKITYTANNSARAKITAAGQVTISKNGPAWFTLTSPATANYKAAPTVEVCVAINKLVVKAKTPKIAASKVKSKAGSVTGLTVTKYKGTLAYSKVKKGSASALDVNKKTGKITVKKGTKKGTYTIKVKVALKKKTAKESNPAGSTKNLAVTYKALNKTVAVKVKVS